LNLKRDAERQSSEVNHGRCAMLAEIFVLRLEAAARMAAKEAAASNPRFVPITLPAAKVSKPTPGLQYLAAKGGKTKTPLV